MWYFAVNMHKFNGITAKKLQKKILFLYLCILYNVLIKLRYNNLYLIPFTTKIYKINPFIYRICCGVCSRNN